MCDEQGLFERLKGFEVMNSKASQGKKTAAGKSVPMEAILASLAVTDDAVLIADEQEYILYFNPAAERMFGRSAGDALGQTLDQFLPPAEPSPQGKRGAKVARLTELLHAKSSEITGQRTAGECFPLEASLTQTQAGGRTLFALTMRDLSIRPPKETAETLQEDSVAEMRAVIFNSAYEFIGLLRPDGTLLHANPSALDFVGATLAEVKDRPFLETPWWAHDAEGRAKLQAGIATAAQGEFVRFEATHRGLSGNDITVDFSLKPVRDEGGAVAFLIPEGRNITERKLAEDKREREHEERLHSILNSIQEIVWSATPDGATPYFVSPSAERVCGRPITDFHTNGQLRLQIIHLEDRDKVARAFQELADKGRYEVEYRITRPDGEVRWLHDRGYHVRDEQGNPLRLDGVASDITERKRAELAMLEVKARTASIVDSAMDSIISVNEEQLIVLFNPAAEKMFGYSAAEMMGQPLERLLPTSARAAHAEYIRRFGTAGTTSRAMGALGAISGVRKNGEEFPAEAAISQMDVDGQKLYTVILRDITRRKEAEKRLIEQAALLNHAREAIIVVDISSNTLFWNTGAERLYGWTAEEMIGRNVATELFREQQEPRETARGVLMEKGEWAGEFQQYTKDGRKIIVESRLALVRDEAGEPKSILIINADITEKKKLEQQFFRAQRMESLGTLAGGIAHDLNNVLSPIAMGVQMLQMKHADEFSRKMLNVMGANAERGAAMIKQILSFARGGGGERIPLQLQHLVKDAIKLMIETFPKEIEIKQKFDQELWLVEGDSTQLHQVLMNLCVNARDAMPHGGTLSISVENQPIDELSARMWPEAKAGNYVALTVADTGEGIPAEHLDRIFDPFFTTKEPGKGTGLGLATVAGIVKAHGGFINVYSELGRGAQFKIYLPAQITLQIAHSETVERGIPAGEGELILVVDDEASIREMTRSVLEAFGYRVLSAADGAEAIGVYAQHPDEVKLVLTDMMMPLMDGLSMIRALLHINPQIKVILSSGLAEERKVAEARQLGIEHFLSKPYNTETLLKTVAQAIRKAE